MAPHVYKKQHGLMLGGHLRKLNETTVSLWGILRGLRLVFHVRRSYRPSPLNGNANRISKRDFLQSNQREQSIQANRCVELELTDSSNEGRHGGKKRDATQRNDS